MSVQKCPRAVQAWSGPPDVPSESKECACQRATIRCGGPLGLPQIGLPGRRRPGETIPSLRLSVSVRVQQHGKAPAHLFICLRA